MDYEAFISYKHGTSSAFAGRMERAISRYARPFYRKGRRIFRDENYLSPGPDLPRMICEALDGSSHLIILGSPESAQSPWVAAEIEHWVSEPSRREKVIIILTDGDIATRGTPPVIDWDSTNALHPALRSHLEGVPLYVDLRWAGGPEQLNQRNPDFKKAINDVVSRLEGVEPITMLGMEDLAHRRAMRASLGGTLLVICLLVVAAVASAMLWKAKLEAEAKDLRISSLAEQADELLLDVAELETRAAAAALEVETAQTELESIREDARAANAQRQEAARQLERTRAEVRRVESQARAVERQSVKRLAMVRDFGTVASNLLRARGDQATLDELIPQAQETLNRWGSFWPGGDEEDIRSTELGALLELWAAVLVLLPGGRVEVQGFPGRWCYGPSGPPDLAPPDLPVSECHIYPTGTDERLVEAQRLAAMTRDHLRELGVESVATIAYDEERLDPGYPRTGTAGEWNDVAAENNRIRVRFREPR